ncbi:MAG: hypothetical protein KDD29_08970 [Flavobacteriales bacterium]|nr:hypothetical protein [Flavobacteriales bacterium]MCB9335454.1 hypothetical protein [Flavobacteriales bacterium]
MKSNNIFKLALAITFIGGVIACAKDRSPSLHITVVDQSGAPAAGAYVHAWPSDDASQLGVTVNEDQMDKTGTTDATGKVSFDFKYSAVLDVDVIYYKTTQVVDTSNNIITVTDSLSGHKVVKIETVRQRSKDNDYEETVIVK